MALEHHYGDHVHISDRPWLRSLLGKVGFVLHGAKQVAQLLRLDLHRAGDLTFRDLTCNLAANRSDLALKVPNARLARIPLAQSAEGFVRKFEVDLVDAVLHQLARHEKTFGDLELLSVVR